MIFRVPRAGSGGKPGLEKRLRSLEQQADVALPGFDAQFYNRAGDHCIDAGQGERARGYYGRAIDAYLRAGRYNAAGAVCRKILRIAPDTVRARCTLAWLAIGKGMIGEAQRELDRYVDAAARAGRRDLAIRQIRWMGRATQDAELRVVLADHLRELGDPAEADRLLGEEPGRDGPEDEVWSRVLRAALTEPGDSGGEG